MAAPRSLVDFQVTVRETDLFILAASRELQSYAGERTVFYRRQVEHFLTLFPGVREQLGPFTPPAGALLPPVVRAMVDAGRQAGVGPMAAVAGAIAEAVGRDLLARSPAVLVENGGDLFLAGEREYTVAVFAGPSPFSGKIGLRLARPAPFAAGVCTSSATVGHSLSFGRADAVVVGAETAALADALATAGANRVRDRHDLQPVVEDLRSREGVFGAVAILGEQLAAAGELELVPLAGAAMDD
ncbi:MAG: UPF0280 family protein [Deltaproteobacteria bacterium]|nr:UPF0280 family protein [Deltaproteobacteria bacterium]